MSDEVWKTLIQNLPQILTAAGVVITAIGTIVIGYFNYRKADRAEKQGQATAATVQSLTATDLSARTDAAVETKK